MSVPPRFPLLYQLNTRVTLRGLSDAGGRQAGFDDIPDQELVRIRALGADWLWLLGVWQTGPAARAISRSNPAWQPGFRHALPDLAADDICGSPFAVRDYVADARFGGDPALARLRARANRIGLRVMLDFVPNHMAPDHGWIASHPERFLRGTEAELAAAPQDWIRLGDQVFAHGRDPYFPGWCDTVQLDYANPDTRSAMSDTLSAIAERCDGVRCDMAMLLLPEIFARTWSAELRGRPVDEFWPEAIAAARARNPDFALMAEAYWGTEPALVARGFDHAYDKALYDALAAADAPRTATLLSAPIADQGHAARFLENHDEPRAAATFPWPRQRGAALLALASPALRFLHQGQIEGFRVHVPIHMDRGPVEPVDPLVGAFYRALLDALADPAFQADYHPLVPAPAWEGNPSHARFVAALWSEAGRPRFLLVANQSPDRGQCRLVLPTPQGAVALVDRLGPDRYGRDGAEMAQAGLFLDLPGWGCHLFALEPAAA